MTPPTPSTPTVRPLRSAEWDEAVALDGAAFGYDPDPEFLADVVRPTLEFERMLAATDPTDNDRVVGLAAALTKDLTFPGLGPAPVAAVTWVAVHPATRRRGILRTLMRTQLDDLHRSGEPVAILTASDPAIYPRFGYGRAIDRARHSVRSRTPLLVPAGCTADPVRELTRAEAWPLLKPRYDRVAAVSPGHLSRTDAVWNWLYSDDPEARGGATTLRFVLHPDGFASYRVTAVWTDRGADSTLTVHELCAATPQARLSLWSHLLSLDLVTTVEQRRGWVDEPLLPLLSQPRGVTENVSDHVWLRLVDLNGSIPLRTYSAPADVTVEITDAFCPWNAGTWRLRLGPDGGDATRVSGQAELRMDVSDLGAAFLGGTSVARLVAAGRVSGAETATTALHDALRTPLAPFCPESF